MKRKFFAAFAAFIMAAALAFGASACSNKVCVVDARINDLGELILVYSDGTTTNLGSVRGNDGSDGEDGKDGVGIKSVYIDKNGHLMVELTDGTTTNLGSVKGNDGSDGENGADGVGIKSVYIDKNGHLMVELTDGTINDCGSFGTVLEGGNIASGDLIYSAIETNGEVTGYSVAGLNRAAATKIVIPDTVNGLPVTAIGEDAFYECDNIKSVTIPDSVKEIGELAFYHCISLESVNFGNGVEVIGDYAFNECFALKAANLPKSVKTIGECAFVYCQSMETLILNDGLTKIGDCAFGGCSSLKSFVMPDSVTSIGWGMLMNGGGGTDFGGIEISPNDISNIRVSANLKEIAEYAFSGCSMSIIRLGDKVETVGYSSFYGCGYLESVIIPKSVKKIVSYAFYQCPVLNAVYYEGTEAEWKNIVIGKNGNIISSDEVVKYFYSETQPTAEGNFWHYVQGEPAKW